MKKATFFEGVGFALISSIVVAIIFTAMSHVFLNGTVFRLLIAGLSLSYLIYLFLRSNESTGRVTVISIWFAMTAVSLMFVSPLLLYIAIQLFMIWIMRSLYFYNSVFSALTDLLLTGMSLVVAIWAMSVSGSVFLSLWCFFLMQALFVYIPKSFVTADKGEYVYSKNDDKFENAYHAAESAVSKLINSK